jgi:hypothetical protein
MEKDLGVINKNANVAANQSPLKIYLIIHNPQPFPGLS